MKAARTMTGLDERTPLRYVDRVWMICYPDRAGVVILPTGDVCRGGLEQAQGRGPGPLRLGPE